VLKKNILSWSDRKQISEEPAAYWLYNLTSCRIIIVPFQTIKFVQSNIVLGLFICTQTQHHYKIAQSKTGNLCN
jgi:hypothetical protein